MAIAGVKTSSLLAEYFMIAVLFPFFKDFKTYKKANIVGFTIGVFVLSIMFIIYILVFDYIPPMYMTHAFTQLTMQTQVDIFFNNISTLFIGFWFIISIIRYAFFVYCIAAIFGYTFKLENYEKLLFPISVLTMIIASLPKNVVTSMLVYKETLIYQTWYVFFLLPLVLWGISKVKGDEVNENI